MSALAAILEAKRREILALGRRDETAHLAFAPRGTVASTLRRHAGQPLRLIAENKRKSPSAGALSTALSVEERVVAYARAGAAMVSVLCDEEFFGGAWADVTSARRALEAAGQDIPVLAKEFILDERQLHEARARGADAVLLIARILDRASLRELHARATGLGLEALVEVVTEEEVEWAIAADATLIGVNARDLDTLDLDRDRAARVLEAVPSRCVSLHLSGLKTADDVRRLAGTRAHGALVGETLMRQDDPAALLGSLVRAAQT